MATVNMTAIKVLVAKDATGALKRAAQERAEQVFNEAVIQMQIDFEDHPVTQEIAGGIFSDNVSKTLPDTGLPTNNLFSFIGFLKGSDPLAPIRDALDPASPMGPKMKYERKDVVNNNARFTWQVVAPDKRAIYKATPMPWGKGMSWAQKIETYIPGFAQFLALHMPGAHPARSRSQGGTQTKLDLNGGEYTPPPEKYLTGIFKAFLDAIRSYRKGGLKRKFL